MQADNLFLLLCGLVRRRALLPLFPMQKKGRHGGSSTGTITPQGSGTDKSGKDQTGRDRKKRSSLALSEGLEASRRRGLQRNNSHSPSAADVRKPLTLPEHGSSVPGPLARTVRPCGS